jgi:hypothetical protein
MVNVVDVVVDQANMLNVYEVGERTAAGHKSALLQEVVEVPGAAEDEGGLGPEDGLGFGLDTLASCQDAEVVVCEVYREGADWAIDCTLG